MKTGVTVTKFVLSGGLPAADGFDIKFFGEDGSNHHRVSHRNLAISIKYDPTDTMIGWGTLVHLHYALLNTDAGDSNPFEGLTPAEIEGLPDVELTVRSAELPAPGESVTEKVFRSGKEGQCVWIATWGDNEAE